MTELLATASQRHVVPLQGRPYEEDQVTGMLTVEFLFKPGSSSQPMQTPSVFPEDSYLGLPHSEMKSVIKKPLGIMKVPTSASYHDINNLSSNKNEEDKQKNAFTPYFDYGNQDLLKPPSRSSSKNKKTLFAEPLESTPTSSNFNSINPQQQQKLSDISNCQVPINSSFDSKTVAEEQDGSFTRGRKRTRTFFNSIKRKLSATRSSSSVIHNANAVDVTNMRSASENRNDTAISRPMSWMSDTSSISGLSGISNLSNRTFVCEESSLVLEVMELDRHHYYLVPLQVAKSGKFKKKGNKLHIYMDHTFVAQHIKIGTACQVCQRKVSLRPGKQGYICRDCGIITHKQCHIKVESHCLQTTVPSLDLEYYSDETKK